MVRVEVALPPEVTLTLDGLIETVGPDGEETAERLTVPANPLRLVTVIVDVVEEPGEVEIDDGFADMEKSPVDEAVTVSDGFVEWEREPLVPVTAML